MKEKGRILLLIPDSQLEKMEKVWRGEIITFGRFKVVTSGGKGKSEAGGGNG